MPADLELDIFECGICTDEIVIPKSLPCLHNFCQDCLCKYLNTNKIKADQSFACPVCRAEVCVPQQGAVQFPTNFHIENLRRRRSSLDLGYSLKAVMQYWDQREEKMIEELGERKKRLLIEIGKRQEYLVDSLEDYLNSLQEMAEVQYTDDSCRTVEVTQSAKNRLTELHMCLRGGVSSDDSAGMAENTSKKDDAWLRLRRQGHTMSHAATEIEDIKTSTDAALEDILGRSLVFTPGDMPADQVPHLFGSFKVVRSKKQTTNSESLVHYVLEQGHVSVLRILSWSQSWWMLLLAVLPAFFLAIFLKAMVHVLKE